MGNRTSRTVILTLIAGTLLACGRGRSAPPQVASGPPPATPYAAPARVYYDNGGGIQDSLRLVIKDAASFEELWRRATSNLSSPPAPPVIDFTRDMVVVASAGRMAPDDQIEIDSVAVTRGLDAAGRMTEMLNVMVMTTTGCRRFNADAYPLEIARLRRFDGPVTFVDRRRQAEGCRAPGARPGARR